MLRKIVHHFVSKVIKDKRGINPLLAGALIGGGVGAIGGLFSKKKVTQGTSFNPEQQALSRTLGSSLSGALAGGSEQFPGQLTAPISPLESQNVSRLGALGQDTLGSLINIDDAAFDQRFRQEIVNPTFRDFRTNIQPLIEESLPSFSIAKGNAVRRGAQEVGDDLLQQRFAAREAGRDRALKGIGQLGDLAEFSAIPRLIQQAGLEREFARFTQGNADRDRNIGRALSFLGLSTKTETSEPSTASNVLGGAATGASGGALLARLISLLGKGEEEG